MAALCATRKSQAAAILRHALIGPGLESPQHGFLHGLFGQIEMRRTEQARQVRHHAARLVPEQVFQQQAPVSGEAVTIPQTCRTSIVPPYSRCGWSSETLDGFVVIWRLRWCSSRPGPPWFRCTVRRWRAACRARSGSRGPDRSPVACCPLVNGFFVQAMYFSSAFCISSGLRFCQPGGIVVKQQHVLWHWFLLLFGLAM